MLDTERLISLTDNLSLVLGRNNGKFPFVNCFFINDKQKAVIDPGRGHYLFLKSLREENLKIINTHFHPEHNTYNKYLNKEVLIHKNDKNAIMSFNNFKNYYGKMNKKLFAVWKKWTTQFLGFAPVKKVTCLSEEEISFGKTTFKIIHTPGHTPGHICFYLPQKKLLLSADIDLTAFGPWYGHQCSSIDNFILSIEKIMKLNIKLFVPSHGLPVRVDILNKLKNYQQIIFKREKIIKSYYENGGEEFAIKEGIKMLYGGKTPKPKIVWTYYGKVMIQKHLNRITNYKLSNTNCKS